MTTDAGKYLLIRKLNAKSKIEKWIKEKEHSYEIEDFLGDGAHGYAFLTKCDKVIKETNDISELLFSQRLEGKLNKNNADVYLTDSDNDNHFIVMEYLDTRYMGIKFFNDIMNKFEEVEENLVDWHNFKHEDATANYSEEELMFIDGIQNGIIEHKKAGSMPDDIQEYNMGLKDNGQIALFDQSNENFNNQKSLDEYHSNKKKQIKKKMNKTNKNNFK